MKNLFSIIFVAALLFVWAPSFSQNLPVVSPAKGTVTPGYIYPLDYSNIHFYYPFGTPTLFNYTRVYTPFRPVTYIPCFDSTRGMPVNVNTTYTDGMGSTLETIQRNNSPYDIITPIDNRHGRTQYGYLPFTDSFHRRFDTIMFTKQKNYYAALYPEESITAYGKTVVHTDHGSPVTENYSPGYNFVGSSVGSRSKIQYNVA